jgi:hypothetical protein
MNAAERYTIRIDVRIMDYQTGGPGLSISEEQQVNAASFLELAGILGQFHEVFEKLRRQQQDKP